MTGITKEMLAQFHADAAEALAPVLAKHGLAGKLGNITHDSHTFRARFEAAPASLAGDSADPRLIKGTQVHGEKYGEKATVSNIGKLKFVSEGMEYTFMGVNQTGHYAASKSTRTGRIVKVRPEQFKAATFIS